MPRSALGSLPVIFHVMVVGDDSDSCSKVTVPVTFESPRTVATALTILLDWIEFDDWTELSSGGCC